MKTKRLLLILPLGIFILIVSILFNNSKNNNELILNYEYSEKEKTSREDALLYTLERRRHEYDMQKNPLTGIIPFDEKQRELEKAFESIKAVNLSVLERSNNTYVSRGPSNLGGRTRALKVDISDNSSNTILAGGVSSGLFRTTDGGDLWEKVSPNDEIHNVTSLAQDPRPGFQNTWYYSTGELSGNSASLGSFYLGQGVWRSTDSGLTWSPIEETNSVYTTFDSFFDIIHKLEVHPLTGDLFIAAYGKIYRYDGNTMSLELEEPDNGVGFTDVTIAADGTVYAALDNTFESINGIWQSPDGNGNWTRIAQTGVPEGWSTSNGGRIVLGTAPSNPDIMYALYANGAFGIEADLWRFDNSTNTWTDFSSKLPDEPGGDLSGNDPFAIQGGYDLVVSVKPDDENFVVIGGTNAYKIEDINTSTTFTRIGGYVSNQSYGLYNAGGVEHHPDIHVLEFDPFDEDSKILFSGTDGGVHKTIDVDATPVTWANLNNNYQTYQFYHVASDPTGTTNFVVGGTQDNGTHFGGTDFGLPNNTVMSRFSGGDGVAVGVAQRTNGIQLYAGTQNGNMFSNLTSGSIQPAGSSSQFVTYFYLDPENTNAIYYAGLSTLYASDDAENLTSFSWTNLGTLPTGENIRRFVATPGTYNTESSNLFIGGQNGGLFRLADPQNATSASDAENITPSGATASPGAVVSGIAIHPTNPDIMMVTYANYGINNIFISTNATAASPTWDLVERNLNNHSVRSAAISEVNGETRYFVGTARGLYSSLDPTTTDWAIEGQNLMGLAVISDLVYRDLDKNLLIGTHGNGMYQTTVETLSTSDFSASKLNLKIFPNPATNYLQISSDIIDISNAIDYRIFDFNGRLVSEGNVNDGKIMVEKLNNGIFFLQVITPRGNQSLKFIKK